MINFSFIPKPVEKTISRLNSFQEDAYLVGGAVRDLLLNKDPQDWDIVTSAPLKKIQEMFPGSFFIGKKQETLQVKVDDFLLEISPYRDSSLSLDEDLNKRDFTINAIAYDLTRKQVIDPLGGRKDLKEGIIRALNPIARFQEDPLRMLRALRFLAQNSFSLEEKTSQGIASQRDLLKNVAIERIRDELALILLASQASLALDLAQKLNLLAVFLPELAFCFGIEQNAYHHLDVAGHILKVVELLPQDNLELRLIGLFHDLGKPYVKSVGDDGRIHFYNHEKVSEDIAVKILNRLKIGSTLLGHSLDRKKILTLVKNHMFFYPPETSLKAVRRFLSRIKPENAKDFLLLHKADIMAGSPANQKRIEDVFRLEKDIAKILNQSLPLVEADLALTGKEIMEYLKIPPGEKVGKIKRKLLKAVLDHPQLNTPEKLKELIEEFKVFY